jgi:hypothetical protein
VGHPSGVAFATMHLGRIAARRGLFEEAFAQLAEARAMFAEIESAADVLEVDARTAECRLLAGDASGALALADEALTRAAGLVERAALERIRGDALVALDRTDEGLAALESSLREALARDARHDVALALRSLVEPNRSEREAAIIFDDLGIFRTAAAVRAGT